MPGIVKKKAYNPTGLVNYGPKRPTRRNSWIVAVLTLAKVGIPEQRR